ncbi:SurA N-terminal domain-containing protein [Catenovulum sp. 2E275]|uniref:SurA N-terminal domain-containing protein n=1 Tax=Catenovulum sp. 2E275 TaxID=2980497 RepID=UPI0021CE615B|nr:SurA N-terminal domain-containing protein [Catenovulum sp. 2E275]MCU4674195.1 SurA N-terminal domain-containing protein [Catenovulum sp. 2E275]
MLEKIREGSQGPVAKVILSLVIVSFAIAGVGSYINSGGEPNAAEVNDLEIKQSQFERAYDDAKRRMESQYGEMFSRLTADPAYLANFKQGVLERLISEQLINDLAKRLSIRISDEQIKKEIFEMPVFQVDGKFNNDRYIQLLSSNNYTPAQFRDTLRQDLTRQAVVSALTDSEFVLENEAKQFQALQAQQRSIEYVEVPVESFKAGVTADDAAIEEYYQQHIASYETSEQLKLSYVELTLDAVASQVEVSDSEVQEYYDANQDTYKAAERRRASHILISTATDDAKAKAQALLAEIKAGADFAELAKEKSEDTFSGENGGDLDFFGKGVMDPAFEEAAFALENIGDVSDVVESSFGYHIIKLTAIEEAKIKPLADVKDDIVKQLQKNQARDIFVEKQQQLADVSFEVPDTLTDAAKAAGLTVKTTALANINNLPAPLNNPKVTDAAMSDDVLNQGYNSSVIEISSDHLVVVRVEAHEPARTKSLNEVKAQVTEAVKLDLAKQAAQSWVEEVNSKWQAGDDISALLAEKSLEVKSEADIPRFGSSVPSPIARKAFEMAQPSNEQASTTWVEVSPAQFALVKLNNVTTAEVETTDQATEQRLLQAMTDYHYQALIKALRETAEVKVYKSTAAPAES